MDYGDVEFYTAGGVLLGKRQPLVAGTTYYAELGVPPYTWTSIQWKWDALIVVTGITVQSSNLVTTLDGVPSTFFGGVSPFAPNADGWQPETAISTITIPGGSSNNQLVHIGGITSRRLRATIVVGGTGGNLRGVPWHKSGF